MSDGEPYNVIPMQGLRRTSNAAFGHQCRSAGAGGILKTAVCDCMRQVKSMRSAMNWPGDVLQVLGGDDRDNGRYRLAGARIGQSEPWKRS
jgi:hypothetical protein